MALLPETVPELPEDEFSAALLVLDDEDREVFNADGEDEVLVPDDAVGLDESQIRRAFINAVEDTVDFVEVEISPSRQKAQKYYNGGTDLGHEPGRSSIVVARVSDVIRQVRPSIMRVLLQSKNPIEFEPRGEEDTRLAEQATVAANYVLMEENDGYRILYDAVTDAMLKRVGITKLWWDDDETKTFTEYTGLTDIGLGILMEEDDVEIVEQTSVLDATQRTHDVIVERVRTEGRIGIATVPPEEIYVDQDATCLDDARVVLHRRDVRVSELVAMGFDFDQVKDLTSGEDIDTTKYEDDQRRGYIRDDSEGSDPANDPASKFVLLTEGWMHLDEDADGVAELRHFMLGGTGYEVLLDEPADEILLADFRTEIEPHAFYPRSLAEITMIDQDQSTVLMRSILDNAQLTNNPRLVVNENAVNIEDTMNGEIGGIIRSTAPGQVTPLTVPFVAGDTLPVMEYLDKLLEAKTGVTQLSAGLSPDALQSTAAVGINAQVQAAQANSELMARNIAEGGFARLAKLILKLLVTHQDREKQIRLNEQFVQIDPRYWHTSLDVRVNVGLGTGQVQDKVQTLSNVATKQEEIIKTLGPFNPFASWQNLRNTYGEMLRLMGFHNLSDFFPQMDEATVQQYMQQQQQGQEGSAAPDPSAGIVMGEQIKAQAGLQEAQLKGQIDIQKALLEDDRKRDETAADVALKSAEIGARYGAEINKERLRAETEKNRYGPNA